MKFRLWASWLLLLFACLLPGCGGTAEGAAPPSCQVVLEEGAGFSAPVTLATVERGSTLTFTLRPEAGYRITGSDYEGCSLSESGGEVLLTLPDVHYSTVVSVTVEQAGHAILYHANGGSALTGDGEVVSLSTGSEADRVNTATGVTLFAREGHTLTGWNTAPDGSGAAVGLGSRVDWEEGLTLYAQWAAWTPAEYFTWEPSGSGAAVTGCTWTGDTLVVPATLGGLPVYTIKENACTCLPCATVVLPQGLRRVETDAFQGCAVETLFLSDDLEFIGDRSFRDCAGLRTLHVNAVEAPVYSGNYFAAFADKFDRLLSLKNAKKLVLFSGSSTRFGYDSAALDRAFPDYEVVNMGVFAYTGAAPQLMLILGQMQEGDILLHSPEFDAAQRQFCTRNDLEDDFWPMMEGNYDMVSLLDLRDFSSALTGFCGYLTAKTDMEPKNYALSPAGFDEDGAAVSTPSYNEYGDYILYRPNAETDAPVYGLGVEYTVSAFPEEYYIAPLNAMYRRFLEKGITVYFTYAPRNQSALSEDSTPEARAALHAYLQEKLIVPVISELEDSLYPGRYLYGTDNHLSTEGVALRTERIIRDLRTQMQTDGLEDKP